MSSILTLANLLTVLRLILTPVFVTALYYKNFGYAFVIFFVSALTDGLDGLAARSLNQKTQLGAMLDPMADKLLLVTAFIVCSLPQFTQLTPIPFWLTIAVISRDIFIVLGALVINMVTGFSSFRPSLPGKVSTVIQLAAVTLFLTANALSCCADYLIWVYYLTFGITVYSGLHYVFHANRLMNENSTAKSSDPE
ncbi:MAG TPA: CDP-alcohol phosphatidyltransferase family protein [Blastocatellia bacterium]|nr:CDP-alcohol phosphatidyltransferase family protein [Blastocatellia bacterium]